MTWSGFGSRSSSKTWKVWLSSGVPYGMLRQSGPVSRIGYQIDQIEASVAPPMLISDGPNIPSGVPSTNQEFAERVRTFVDELGVARPHVAGCSLGGHIALLLAARGVARSAVAFSPTGFWTKSEARYTRILVRSLRAGALASRPLINALSRTAFGRSVLLGSSFAKPAVVPPADAAEVASVMCRSTGFGEVLRAANSERLGGAPASTETAASAPDPELVRALAEVPVTVAWAQRDKFLPIKQAERAAKALPSSAARSTSPPVPA